MLHIRQKASSFNPGEVYAVVITDGWEYPLELHPSIIEQPEIFEIADCEIPPNAEYSIYE